MREVQKKPNAPIDLPPHEWRSERPKRREPILGSGAGALLGELLVIASGFGLLIVVALLGASLKGTVYNLLYGEPSSGGVHSAVPPGAYTWTPGDGLKPAPSIAPPR